jgi:hypothetical protein
MHNSNTRPDEKPVPDGAGMPEQRDSDDPSRKPSLSERLAKKLERLKKEDPNIYPLW